MLKEEELLRIKGGGINFTPTLINAISRLISTIMEIGQSVGSSIRRVTNQKYCKIS